MSKIVNVEVPDIGDFTDVDIIEVLVSVGDSISEEDALIELHTKIWPGDSATVKEIKERFENLFFNYYN